MKEMLLIISLKNYGNFVFYRISDDEKNFGPELEMSKHEMTIGMK